MYYKGYTYTPWEDRDDDCVKIWHEFKSESGTTVTCDWSPYEYMNIDDIRLWIDLDLPGRISSGPLNRQDLRQLWNEYLEVMTSISNSNID